MMNENRRRRHTSYNAGNNDPATSKNAYVFLCLFDGFRVPSVRRLTRKPQTICFEPLINFDPSLFAPAATNAINKRYEKEMKCKCMSVIDPTIHEVTEKISLSVTRSPNERIIIHYFGQGSISPTKNGNLYFFDSKHTSYRGLHVNAVIGPGQAPVAMIIDVNSAGVLVPTISKIRTESQRDLIAFMSCSEGESLPSAPSLPLDFLSCSVLFTIDSAIWLHLNRSVFDEDVSVFTQEVKDELAVFLAAIIDSIAVSRLNSDMFELLFTTDTALTNISRGYILASRILSCYNVHTCSVPEIPQTDDSPIWGYWDLALDAVIAEGGNILPELPDVVEQLIISFINFPDPNVIPIFCHFLQKNLYVEKFSSIILNYMDTTSVVLSPALNQLLVRSFFMMQSQTSAHFLILAKLFIEKPFDQINVILLNRMLDFDDILPAAFLSVSCFLCATQSSNHSLLLQKCKEKAEKGLPCSALLFGLVVQKTTAFETNIEYVRTFSRFLKHEREDVRAACVFALGNTRNVGSIEPLTRSLNDKSDLVVSEALVALSMALRFDMDRIALDELIVSDLRESLKKIENSQKDVVKDVYDVLKPNYEMFFSKFDVKIGKAPESPRAVHASFSVGGIKLQQPVAQLRQLPTSRLPLLFRQSVRATNLRERYTSNVFNANFE